MRKTLLVAILLLVAGIVPSQSQDLRKRLGKTQVYETHCTEHVSQDSVNECIAYCESSDGKLIGGGCLVGAAKANTPIPTIYNSHYYWFNQKLQYRCSYFGQATELIAQAYCQR